MAESQVLSLVLNGASRADFIIYSDQLSEAHQIAVMAANAKTDKLKKLY